MKSGLFQSAPVKEGTWKSHHGPMHVIDFSLIDKFDDTFAAYGCITICSSNGRIGTLTHLDTTDIENIESFIEALDKVLFGNKENSKIILSGGSALKESQALSKKIEAVLSKHDYTVIGKYLDHKTGMPTPKVATLESDKVIIKEFVTEKMKNQFTEISFADGHKNVYLKEKEAPQFKSSQNSSQ